MDGRASVPSINSARGLVLNNVMNLHFGLRGAAEFAKYCAMLKNLSLILLCACLFLSSCGQNDDVRQRVADAKARNDGPPIWVVEDYDSKLYLYGTVHLLPSDLDWQKNDMKDVFDESGTVFFELDTSGQAGIDIVVLTQSLGQYQGGRRLSDGFDSYQIKLLEAVSHNGKIPLGVLQTMKPWLAGEMITMAAAQDAGLTAELSADEALKNRAERLQKNVIYLDDAETQIRASADLPRYAQLNLLVETMEKYNSIGSDLVQIAEKWAEGNERELRDMMGTTMKDRSPELYEALIVKRNQNWTEQMTRFMEDSGTGFAAVGLSHLLGEDSVQNMLRDQGYNVSRYFAFKGEPVIKATPLGEVNPGAAED